MAKGDIRLARLFYEIEADTKGLKQDLDAAERSFGRIATFIEGHPTAALGALAAAFVGVGIKATLMADQTDQALRKIGAVLPDAARKTVQLRGAIDQLAKSSGVSQEELLATAQVIARAGVSSTEELLTRLRVIQQAADATGADMQTLAQSLDQVLDTFGLSGDQIEVVAAKLKAATQGKESIEELTAAFQTAAPTLRTIGVDFNTAVGALAKFTGEGLNAKQAGSALKDLAEKGEAAFRAFAPTVDNTTEALQAFHEAANLVGDSASRNADRLRETLSADLRELGTILLPLVNAGLKGTLSLLQAISHPEFLSVLLTGNAGPLAARLAAERAGPPTTSHPTLAQTRIAPPEPFHLTEAQLAALKKLREDAGAFALDTQKQLAELTGDVVDQNIAALEAFLAKYAKLVDGMNAAQRATANAVIAELQRKIADIRELGANEGARLDLTRNGATVEQEHASLVAAGQPGSGAITGTGSIGPREVEKVNHTLAQQIQLIAQATAGVLDLADAFGVMGKSTAEALGNIVQIADSAARLAEAQKAAKELGQSIPTADLISGALSIGGAIASLLSSLTAGDPNVKLLQETNDKLRLAVDNLREHFDSFAHNLTGTQQVNVATAVDALLHGRGGNLSTLLHGDRINGVGLGDLQNAAKDLLGQSLDTDNVQRFLAGLKKLQEALALADRTRFADSFAGQVDALTAQLQILDDTNPLDKLKGLLAILTDVPRTITITNPDGSKQTKVVGHGSPAIANALTGLDLGKAGDRAKALDKLTELLDQLTRGQLDAQARGDLTPDEFKNQLLELAGLLRDANAQAGGTNQSFAVDRTITEVTGSRIAAVLDTGLLYQQNLTVLPEIRDLLDAALSAVLLQPPALPGSVAAAAAGSLTITIGAIEVTIAGSAAGADAASIGQAVGAQVVDQMLARQASLKIAVAGGVLQ